MPTCFDQSQCDSYKGKENMEKTKKTPSTCFKINQKNVTFRAATIQLLSKPTDRLLLYGINKMQTKTQKCIRQDTKVSEI